MFIASTYPKEFYEEVCKKLLHFPDYFHFNKSCEWPEDNYESLAGKFSIMKSMVYIGHYRINTDEKNKRCQNVDDMGISMEIPTLT